MSIRKLVLLVACVLLPNAGLARAELILTGVLDGTLTGGSPKVAEVFAGTPIPDLSIYGFALGANGNPFGTVFPLANISLAAGEYYYGVGNAFDDMTDDFDAVFPGMTTQREKNDAVNSNGDDVIGLFKNGTLIDVFGVVGVDGTGQPWEHTDGYGYRKNGTGPSPVFNINEWTIAFNTLDNLTAEQLNAAVPFGEYAIPEPASMSLAGLGLLGALLVRRRRR
jgi:hypothetical protein